MRGKSGGAVECVLQALPEARVVARVDRRDALLPQGARLPLVVEHRLAQQQLDLVERGAGGRSRRREQEVQELQARLKVLPRRGANHIKEAADNEQVSGAHLQVGRLCGEGLAGAIARRVGRRTVGEQSAEKRREKGDASVERETVFPARSSTSSAGGQPNAPDSVAIASDSAAVKKAFIGSSESPPRA